MPGSPQLHSDLQNKPMPRPIHPAALLLACALVGLGLSLGGSPLDLAVCAIVGASFALRAEGRSIRSELSLWVLALILFLAHTFLSGRPIAAAVKPAAVIALRLLALLYLLRWAARAFLGQAARWLLAFDLPRRPRALLLVLESGRHAVALAPLALRESERQHEALRARGLTPPNNAAGRARYVAAWLLPYLGTMLRLGECYGEALLVRGYAMGVRRSSGQVWRWDWAESATVVLAAASAAWLLRGL